jgi:hypothetical protein
MTRAGLWDLATEVLSVRSPPAETGGSGDSYHIERVFMESEQAHGVAQNFQRHRPGGTGAVDQWQVGPPARRLRRPYRHVDWWAGRPVAKQRGAPRHIDERERFDDFAIRQEWWTGEVRPRGHGGAPGLAKAPKIEVAVSPRDKVKELFWEAVT